MKRPWIPETQRLTAVGRAVFAHSSDPSSAQLREPQTDVHWMSREAHVVDVGAEDLTDPLTGFGTHRRLIVDLEASLATPAPPKTVVIFDLGGFDGYLDLRGRIEAQQLLGRLSARLVRRLAGAASFYRPRYSELVVLAHGSALDTEPLLKVAVAELNAEFGEYGMSLTYGAAELPIEADTPIDALILADTRLFLDAHARRARERRSLPRAGSR